jgi:glycine/D-amino acid oxidase-like deaminating enzyme
MSVGVVGAGIVGLATAYELVSRGATVTVYEQRLAADALDELRPEAQLGAGQRRH